MRYNCVSLGHRSILSTRGPEENDCLDLKLVLNLIPLVATLILDELPLLALVFPLSCVCITCLPCDISTLQSNITLAEFVRLIVFRKPVSGDCS